MNDNPESIKTAEEVNDADIASFNSRFAHFLVKTGKSYVTSDYSYLIDRGIANRLLESLLAYLPDGAIIAGGFALSVVAEEQTAKDIDIFFTSKEAFQKTMDLFLNPPEDTDAWAFKGYSRVDDSEIKDKTRYVALKHATRPHVQLLKMTWYDGPEHVIDSFDFTISQFAFTNRNFVYNGEAMIDLARKRLVLHRMQFPASTLRRLIKYAAKGYYACPGSLAKICTEIQKFTGEPDISSVVYVD